MFRRRAISNRRLADCSYILSQATMMHDMTAAAIVILVSCCIAAGGTPVPGRITPTVLEATTLGGSETPPVPSLIPASPAPGTIQAPTPPSHDRVWVVVGQQMLPVQLCFLIAGRESCGHRFELPPCGSSNCFTFMKATDNFNCSKP